VFCGDCSSQQVVRFHPERDVGTGERYEYDHKSEPRGEVSE